MDRDVKMRHEGPRDDLHATVPLLEAKTDLLGYDAERLQKKQAKTGNAKSHSCSSV